MGHPLRSVIFNAREELLSGDINRAQQVLSKALQDEDMGDSSADTGPISSWVTVPPIAGIAASFDVSVGVGEGRIYDVSGAGVDDSAFAVLLTAVGNLTHAAPDPTNNRIDLIVAQLGIVESDSSSRNILTDPVARTFAPAPVFKTAASIATLSVVAGTPGATPAPPAVPAGKFALWEVLVPAAAPDATTFSFIQRMFRRTSYPLTGGILDTPQCGVLRGCRVTYTGVFEAISQASGIGLENQVLIDGEVISFGALSSAAGNDTLANPFGVAAPAGNDKPYYLYVVGGRNLPSASGAAACSLVASLTAPDPKSGRPLSPLGAPRGTTSSACYVGLGFVLKNTTNHQVCRAIGDFLWFAGVGSGDDGFEVAALAAAGVSLTLASAPSISDEAKFMTDSVGGAGALNGRLPGMAVSNSLFSRNYAGATAGDGNFDSPIVPGAGPHIALVSTTTMNLRVLAYRMNVRRLG